MARFFGDSQETYCNLKYLCQNSKTLVKEIIILSGIKNKILFTPFRELVDNERLGH